MAESDYRAQIERAWLALVNLAEQRKALTCEISELRYLIVAHANMLSDDERDGVLEMLELIDAPAGMSSAILKILMNDDSDGLTVTEIKTRLLDTGYDISDQSNPLASISTTLQRMIPRDVIETTRPQGKRTYRYKWKAAAPLHGSATTEKPVAGLLLEMRKSYLLAQRLGSDQRIERYDVKRSGPRRRRSEAGWNKR